MFFSKVFCRDKTAEMEVGCYSKLVQQMVTSHVIA